MSLCVRKLLALKKIRPICFRLVVIKPRKSCRYSGRGLFLDPPTVFLCDGIWKLQLPENIHAENVKMEDFCK